MPDKVYRELKKRAEELGIQVTDLVKVYIRLGLNGSSDTLGLGGTNGHPQKEEELLELKRAITELIQTVEERFLILEGRIQNLRKLISNLSRRVSRLEDDVEEMRTPFMEEPEILAARNR